MDFVELVDSGVIAFRGADASAFLHAQLTSDVAGLEPPRTQYSGYCTAQGRLLATFLVWRLPEVLLTQLPRELAEAVQMRLSRYVLRSRVELSNAEREYGLFGVWGEHAGELAAELAGEGPQAIHDTAGGEGVWVTRLPTARYLLLVGEARVSSVRAQLASRGGEQPAESWKALDIEAGIPEITRATQDRFVPQMVNLDLIGAVSYSKGCYPGQEIVARTHYLGRVKQRMYRARIVAQEAPGAGDPLYSSDFGSEQASGTIVSAARVAPDAFEVLAVIQTVSAAGGVVHWKAPDGPVIEFRDLPYAVSS
jgi:tRNA-modifying protein YgfZ